MAHENNGWRDRIRKHSDLILALLFVGLAIADLVIRSNDIEKFTNCGEVYQQTLATRTEVSRQLAADIDRMVVGISTILSTNPLPQDWQALIGEELKVYYVARTSLKVEDAAALEPVTC